VWCEEEAKGCCRRERSAKTTEKHKEGYNNALVGRTHHSVPLPTRPPCCSALLPAVPPTPAAPPLRSPEMTASSCGRCAEQSRVAKVREKHKATATASESAGRERSRAGRELLLASPTSAVSPLRACLKQPERSLSAPKILHAIATLSSGSRHPSFSHSHLHHLHLSSAPPQHKPLVVSQGPPCVVCRPFADPRAPPQILHGDTLPILPFPGLSNFHESARSGTAACYLALHSLDSVLSPVRSSPAPFPGSCELSF
jgi:hypothetical protein